jgi:hypothetical protein
VSCGCSAGGWSSPGCCEGGRQAKRTIGKEGRRLGSGETGKATAMVSMHASKGPGSAARRQRVARDRRRRVAGEADGGLTRRRPAGCARARASRTTGQPGAARWLARRRSWSLEPKGRWSRLARLGLVVVRRQGRQAGRQPDRDDGAAGRKYARRPHVASRLDPSSLHALSCTPRRPTSDDQAAL